MDEVLRPKLDCRPARALCRGCCKLRDAVRRIAARRRHRCIVQCMPGEPVERVVGMLDGGEREPVEVPDHASTNAHPA